MCQGGVAGQCAGIIDVFFKNGIGGPEIALYISKSHSCKGGTL